MAYGTDARKTKREKLTDSELERVVCDALKTSLGAPDSDVGQARLRNLEYYNAEPVGELAPPEIEDRSDFVATDVADTVEWMLPQLMRIFVSSDDAVEFQPRRPDQEQVAKLATGYVNHLFYVRNPGVEIIYDWFKDALLQKVGFIKVWVEEEAEDSKQTFEGITEEQVVMLLNEGWEPDGDPEVDEQGLLTITVGKEERRKCIKVAVCAPHEVRVDANARWGEEPAFVAHVFRKRGFELLEEGYDLENVGPGSGVSDMEAQAMLGETADEAYSEPHESHALYQVAEAYIQVDRDGDGIAEWLKVCLIEDKLATVDGKPAIEQVDGHPFVWICPIPRPHAFFGDCPADLAIQPQKLRTNVVRAIQDNLYLTVNQRTYLNTNANVNIADWLDNRPGGVVRGEGPAGDAIQPIPQPSLGAPAYQFNEWLEGWKENRTGFTRYSQGTDANSLNKTATGVNIITQKADMRMELMARFFAVGMRQLFAKILKLAVKHQQAEEMVKLNGQWVAINPSEWRDQLNVNIKVGLGTGSKEQQAARIMGLVQILQLGAQAGVVQPKHMAEAIRLYVEANEFKQPERFVDPEPSGMPPSPQAFQQMQQQVQEQMQKLQGQLQQMAQENEGLKAEKAAKEGDLALNAAKLELQERELALEEARTGADLQMRAVDHQQRMDSAANEESAVAQLQEQVAMLGEAVSQIMAFLQPQEPEIG